MRVLKVVFILFFLVKSLSIQAQSVEISVQVLQAFSSQAKLYLFTGTEFELIDSSLQSAPGTYHFKLREGYQQGMYKVEVGKNTSFNLIVGNESFIDISTVVYAPEDSLKSLKSIENTIYWEFQRMKKKHKQHAWLIQSLMDYYSDSLPFYQTLKEELISQNSILFDDASKLMSKQHDLLATKIIGLEQRFPHQEFESNQLTEAWWGNVDLTDARLMHTPALQTRLWNYIEQFSSDNYDKEEQDEAFIRGVKSIMNLEMSSEIKVFIRNTLISGFYDSDYLAVLEFIETTKFGDLEPIRESTPLSKYAPKINVGEKAFDFVIPLSSGKSTKLSKIKADYKLVLFWSTWCPHCIESMPRITEIYNEYKDKGFEVVAVSIDNEEQLWKLYINNLNLNWINLREPYAQESKLIYMYDVHETPKMFLLSKDLTIISRPATRRQLEVRLKRLIK